MLNLNNRDLMALELLKSMLESPFYFDEQNRKVGVDPTWAAKEAVQLADALQMQLATQAPAFVNLTNEAGDYIPVKTDTVAEVKRLVADGRDNDAKKLLKDEGVSPKSCQEYVDGLKAEKAEA